MKKKTLDMDSDTFWDDFEKSDSASLSDFDSDSDLDPESVEYINRDMARNKEFEKFVRKDLYMRDLYDEDICEQVYIEAYNYIYDVY